MDFQNCDYHRDYDFNTNALYDSREDATKKQTEFYLSPYGPTCFQYMLRQGTEGGYMEITVSRRYGTFCAFLFIQNSITRNVSAVVDVISHVSMVHIKL